MQNLTQQSMFDTRHYMPGPSARYPASTVAFVSILFILWAAASIAVADSISLKFEDNQVSMESLADNPAVLLALHAAALHCGIDFQWDPAQERMILSKNGVNAVLVSGNRHALITKAKTQSPSLLRPLSEPPAIFRGALALPPQDIALLLQDLLPSMDVSWEEAKSMIEVKERAADVSKKTAKFELKTVIIDPGHGGYDPGAASRGTREEHIVLDVSLKLAKMIESESDWEVVLTRDSDRFVTLKGRTQIANQYPADSTLFISVHCNADRRSLGRGVETFVFDLKATDAEAAALAERENANEEMDLTYILNHCYHVGNEPYSLQAAKKVQSSLVRKLKLRNRGVKRAPFYVLAGTKMPAILLELGFVTNLYDRKKLQSDSFRQSAAEALFEAIKDFNKTAARSLVRADIR